MISDRAHSREDVIVKTPVAGDVRLAGDNRLTLVIAVLTLALMTLGTINLYSAGQGMNVFRNHLAYLVLGLSCYAFCGWLIPLRWFHDFAYPVLAIAFLLLIIVLFLGETSWGAQRWLSLGPVRFQPSELAKLAMAAATARYFGLHRQYIDYRLRDLILPVALIALMFLPVFLQPDLGTAGIIALIAACQLAFLPIDRRSLAILFTSGFFVALVGWTFFLHDYQRLRVLTLFNPQLDPSVSGYNSLQSLVAIGSGKLMGKGWLQGTQSQLQFLPARHTDFAFAAFAEEHGFWASLVVFVLFAALTYVALEIGRQAKDSFKSLFAIGIAALLFVSIFINIAMVLGLFPVVGIPLPFFSFGGTALIVNCASIGILTSINRDTLGQNKKPGLEVTAAFLSKSGDSRSTSQ